MAIPDFQSLMLPLLVLSSSGDISLSEGVDSIAIEFGLSEGERQVKVPSGGRTLIRNRVMWAVTCLVKAGLMERPQRGYFSATAKGREVLQKKPKIINNKFLTQFPEFCDFRAKKNSKGNEISSPDSKVDPIETPEERIGIAYEEITEEIKSEILKKVMESSPEFFEKLIVQLLLAMGYGGTSERSGKHLGKSGDGGIDGVIDEDKLGLDTIYLQAKKYASGNTVGRPDIQKFAGSLIGEGANKGVFVTTSSFSNQAYEYAKNVPQKIILINGERLTSLMFEHNVGVRLSQKIEIKKVDEDFFSDFDG